MSDDGAGVCSIIELEGAIAGYSRSLHSAYIQLVVNTAFTSLLFPFFCALFYFARPGQWRTPVFVCVTLSVFLAFWQAAVKTSIELRILFDPLLALSIVTTPVLVLMAFLEILPNFCADLALLCRMLAVYPPSLTSRANFAAVVGPAIAMKLMRIVSITIVLVYGSRNQIDAIATHFTSQERTWAILDRCITALDNVYVTVFFLWKLKPVVRPNAEYGRYSAGDRGSLGSRIRSLFWTSVTCFALPAPLYVIQCALAIVDPSAITYALILDIGNFTSAVCVAFATIWCSTSFQASLQGSSADPERGVATSLHFAPSPIRPRHNDSTLEEDSSRERSIELPTMTKSLPVPREEYLHAEWSRETKSST